MCAYCVESDAESVNIYEARLNTSAYEGTMEVLTSWGWLPVCLRYSRWGHTESSVFCRQLGYNLAS